MLEFGLPSLRKCLFEKEQLSFRSSRKCPIYFTCICVLITKRFHNSNGRYFDTMLLKIIKWFENVQNGYKNFDNIGFLGLCVKNGCTEDEAGG